jgi:hypothetical protein
VLTSILLLLTVLATDPTVSDGVNTEDLSLPRRGVVPAVAALVPGFLVHGSGHFAGGDRATAWRLFHAEAVGAMLIGVGVAGLMLTGASRRTIEPFVWTTAAGTGLFVGSWLADVYGVLAPPGGTGGPIRVLPTLEAKLGTLYVSDPTLAGDVLGGAAIDLRWDRWRLSPGAWFAMDGANNSRFEGALAFRFVGPRAGADVVASSDGSFVDLVAGAVHHRYSEDAPAPLRVAFDTTTLELHLDGRYDLRRFAPSLAGAFVEGGAGAALGWYNYPAPATTEAAALLLARLAFGVYLGRRAERWGELRAYYDQRHDGYAGGLKSGLTSGPVGHIGADVTFFVTERWGLGGDVEAGSAVVAGLTLIYRHGRVEL